MRGRKQRNNPCRRGKYNHAALHGGKPEAGHLVACKHSTTELHISESEHR